MSGGELAGRIHHPGLRRRADPCLGRPAGAGFRPTLNGLDSLTPETLLLLVPLLVVQLGLMVLAIVDLLRDDRRVRGGNKGIWAVVIVFVSMIGPILYFLVGRDEGPVEPVAPGPGAVPGWGSPHDPPIVSPPATSPNPVTSAAASLAVAEPPGAAGPAPAPLPADGSTGGASPRPLRSDAPPAITIEAHAAPPGAPRSTASR
jgi:hypothetical protein